MSGNFDAALKTGAYGDVETGYQQQQAIPTGYPVQAGYPVSGAYGTDAAHGAQYPYPPPPPIGGGSEDEKFTVGSQGVCTAVPGLKKSNPRLVYIIIMATFGGVSLVLLLLGGALLAALKDKGPGISIGATGGISLGLVLMLHLILVRTLPKNYPRITEEAIAEYIEKVTKLEATLLQINAVRSLMSQANPNTAHVFQVWRAPRGPRNERGLIVSANFGLQNLPKGQQPQMHLYELKHF